MSDKTTLGPATLRPTQYARSLCDQAATKRMQTAADNADQRAPGWSDLALQFLRDCVLARGSLPPAEMAFTAEDVRRAARRCYFPDPPDARAWGAVFRRAQRDGLIKPAGMQLTGNDWGGVCRKWIGAAYAPIAVRTPYNLDEAERARISIVAELARDMPTETPEGERLHDLAMRLGQLLGMAHEVVAGIYREGGGR